MKNILLFSLFFTLSPNLIAGTTIEQCKKAETTEYVADCIEDGVYDPCNDATGKFGLTRCVKAHSLVAERRIEVAMRKIKTNISRSRETRMYAPLKWSHKNWLIYRDQFCIFKNDANNHTEYFNSEDIGHCILRMNREKAESLESMVKNKY